VMGVTARADAPATMEHPAMWDLEVDIVNDGEEPLRLSLALMTGSVAVEIEDERGAPVPLGPPPTPPDDLAADLVMLAPGESVRLSFHGDELLPDRPPPGRYRARFAAQAPEVDGAWSGRVESPWVRFEVA
jgi:hypothetical protein